MPKKTLYAHQEESIAYLINRIENTEADEILISTDDNPELFTDLVNLKLLKREADAMGKKVSLISQNQAVVDMAADVGFDVAAAAEESPLKSALKNPKKTKPSPQPVRISEILPEESSDIVLPWMKREGAEGNIEKKEESIPVVAQSGQQEFSAAKTNEQPILYLNRKQLGRGKRSRVFHLIILAAVGGLAIFGSLMLLTPKLSLKVIPKKEILNFEFKTIADINISSVDLEKNKIPGQIIKIEKELNGEFSATGKQEQASKAEGIITIYNDFGPVVQKLVQNTRFKTKDGKIFRLKEAVNVPGAKMEGNKVVAPGIISARVVADEAGSDYNIGPTDFVIPGFDGTPKFVSFYGKSSDYMKGGASGNSLFATDADLQGAREDLNVKLAQAAKDYVNANMPKGMKTIEDGKLDGQYDFSAEPVNQESGKFKATMKAAYSIFAFAESDIAALVAHNLLGRMADAYVGVPGTQSLSYSDGVVNADKTKMEIKIKVSETSVGKINKEEIAAQLAGKDENQIREILSSSEAIESVELTFRPFPFWNSSAPADPKNIKVIVEE